MKQQKNIVDERFLRFQIFEGYVEGEVNSEIQEVPQETADAEIEVISSSDIPADQQQQLITPTIPMIESLTIESRTFTQQLGPIPVEPSLPQQPHPIADQTVPPVEPIYYQVSAQIQPQSQQPPRPITEMLGTGSFFFLQVN